MFRTLTIAALALLVSGPALAQKPEDTLPTILCTGPDGAAPTGAERDASFVENYTPIKDLWVAQKTKDGPTLNTFMWLQTFRAQMQLNDAIRCGKRDAFDFRVGLLRNLRGIATGK